MFLSKIKFPVVSCVKLHVFVLVLFVNVNKVVPVVLNIFRLGVYIFLSKSKVFVLVKVIYP